jgi:hypothetical protein
MARKILTTNLPRPDTHMFVPVLMANKKAGSESVPTTLEVVVTTLPMNTRHGQLTIKPSS